MQIPQVSPLRLALMAVAMLFLWWCIIGLTHVSLVAGALFCLLLPVFLRFVAQLELRRAYLVLLCVVGLSSLMWVPFADLADTWMGNRLAEYWQIAAKGSIAIVVFGFGAALVWLGLMVLTWASSDLVSGIDVYVQQDGRAIRRMLILQSLGLGSAFQVIEKGRVAFSGPKGTLNRLSGRCLLVIQPANAVVTEAGGEIKQVLGPGTHWMRRFEGVKEIIDLNPRRAEFDISAQTREGVPIAAHVLANYQILPANALAATQAAQPVSSEAAILAHRLRLPKSIRSGLAQCRLRIARWLRLPQPKGEPITTESARIARRLRLPQPKGGPINTEAVLRAVYCSNDHGWRPFMEDTIKLAVVQTINRHTVRQLADAPGAPLTELSNKARGAANHRALAYGMQVRDLTIVLPDFEAGARSRILEPMLAQADAQAASIRGQTEISIGVLREARRSELRTAEVQRLVSMFDGCRDRMGDVPLIHLIQITERLVGELADKQPDDGLRLLQSVEDAIDGQGTRGV